MVTIINFMGRELVNGSEGTTKEYCFIADFNLTVVGKYILLCNKYIFRLIILVPYSLTHLFSTFNIGLIFIRTVTWVNLVSMLGWVVSSVG